MFDRVTKEDLSDEIQALFGDRKIILAVRFGSALYGTETPDSDNDIRVVFLPTAREILLGEVDFSINGNPDHNPMGKGDMDIAGYSLTRFLNLLGKFDMGAIELLFASRYPHATLHCDPAVDWIYNSRTSLIATNDSSTLSAARANLGPMAPDSDDYSFIFSEVKAAFQDKDHESKIIDHLDLLDSLSSEDRGFMVRTPDGDIKGDQALEVILDENRSRGTSFFFTMRNRKVDLACPTRDIITVCNSALNKKKKFKSGVTTADPKNLYHALRVLDQIIEVTVFNNLTFPRGDAALLRRVRAGEVPEKELRGHINLYFQTAIEAEKDLPFPKERCLETYESMLMRIHRDVIEKF